jgi:hypothetical protein
MSKESLLSLGNFNLFKNESEKVQFKVSKDESVQANYNGYDASKYDVRGVVAKSKAGLTFIRLAIATIEGEKREYHNAALFTVKEKKSEKSPDYTGSIDLDNQPGGPKLRLAAWKKKGTKVDIYLSVAISEAQEQDAPTPVVIKNAPVVPMKVPTTASASLNAMAELNSEDVPF